MPTCRIYGEKVIPMSDEDILEKIDNKKKENNGNEKEPHVLESVNKYIADEENIEEKGNITEAQAVLFSIGANVYEPYKDHISETTFDFIKEFIKDLERRQISINGMSRDEFREILKAMLGSWSRSEESEGGKGGFVQSFLDAEAGKKDE